MKCKNLKCAFIEILHTPFFPGLLFFLLVSAFTYWASIKYILVPNVKHDTLI